MPMSERTARAAAFTGFSCSGVEIAVPCITMRPSLGVSSRAMQRSSVVLPEPLGPTMQTTSRSITGSETRVSTWCSPNFLLDALRHDDRCAGHVQSISNSYAARQQELRFRRGLCLQAA